MSKWIKVRHLRSPFFGLLLGVAAIVMTLLVTPWLSAKPAATLPPSQYASTIAAPFNQPAYYPIKAAPPSKFYRPVSAWVGRLILPPTEQYQQQAKKTQETDWAWFEVYAAPAKAKTLIGKTVRLTWQKDQTLQDYVKAATGDVQFVPSATQAYKHGVTVPIRLDGRKQVGPLQSLAGGHPYDDVTVALRGNVVAELPPPAAPQPLEAPPAKPAPPGARPPVPAAPSAAVSAAPFVAATLRIDREPIQETGRFYGLVKFLEAVVPKESNPLPIACPGEKPCASDRLRVQHYNPKTRQFDGPQEVIYIPQQPADVDGVFNMTTRELVNSSAGEAGWYIYGAQNSAGMFTVQALQPRSLVQLKPQQTITGLQPAIHYVINGNWNDVADRKGTLQTVLVSGKTQADTASANPSVNVNDTFPIGTRMLVLHLYGGRGGSQPHRETFVGGTYPGHFSFGLGQVVADPFTQEPILNVDYLQVYGNGVDGTLSGANTWANYMGNLRRGVLGTRPVSDVLIKLDALTEDYTFGDTKLSFFKELLGQLSLIGARYRIGDGTGDSTITAATSCVQDSAQGVFLTLVRFKDKVENNPQVVEWMKAHPDDPNTRRFQQLVALADDLATQLTPMGVVRWDWRENGKILTGIRPDNTFTSIDNFQIKNLATGLLSWRTALPRQAHDEFSMLFLQHGATLWFLRSNQVGGQDPTIAPLEPTLLFGAWKLPFTNYSPLSHLVIRTFGGVTIPNGWEWLITLVVAVIFSAIALAIGFFSGILTVNPVKELWYQQVGAALRFLVVPALLEEYVFRVLLIPYPRQWMPAWSWWSWAFLALGVYVGFHGWRIRRQTRRKKLFKAKPLFLVLIALFGLSAIVTYRLTASLWTITILHWLVVTIWWLLLGGKKQLFPRRIGYT